MYKNCTVLILDDPPLRNILILDPGNKESVLHLMVPEEGVRSVTRESLKTYFEKMLYGTNHDAATAVLKALEETVVS